MQALALESVRYVVDIEMWAGPDFPIGRVGQRPRAHHLRGAHQDQNAATAWKAV